MKHIEEVAHANSFLQSAGATMSIVFVGELLNRDWEGETEPRLFYEITIKTPKGKEVFSFWNSIADTRFYVEKRRELLQKNGKGEIDNLEYIEALVSVREKVDPTAYDLLASVTKHHPRDFRDFCAGYGYDIGNAKDRKLCLAAVEEFEKVQQLFTEEQIEQLREIN